MANQKQKRKRDQTASTISQGGLLTVQEGQNRIQTIQNTQEVAQEQARLPVRKRAPPRCSMCGSLEHTARTCPERYATK